MRIERIGDSDEPQGSEWGLEDVRFRAGSQKALLLEAYAWSDYTSEEAAIHAGLTDIEHWARCGELRRKKLLEWATEESGKKIYRMGSKGSYQGVQRLTARGQAYLKGQKSA